MNHLKHLAIPAGSVAACLILTLLGLALLPATREDDAETPRPYTYVEKVTLVLRTTYERVILPRRPDATEGYRNWILTLQSATPLLLTGLAIAAAFRAGVLNIGGQGQYVLGAIAGAAIGIYLPAARWLVIPLLLVSSMIAGALIAAIAAALERWRRVPVVLSTLLLNFVALEFLRYLLQGPMRATSDAGALLDPQSLELPEAARLPEFFAQTSGVGLHLGFFIALVMAAGLAFLLRKTTFGFRLRVVGQNAVAARFAGMNVGRVSVATLALSGALAGLAGGVQVSGATHILFPDVGTDGIGFAGIAVALLARLSPIGVIFSALFFGLLNTAFRALERSPLEVHSSTALGVQGALVIVILVATSARWRRLFSRPSKFPAGL